MAFADSLLGFDPFFAEFDRISQRLLDTPPTTGGAAMPMDVVRRDDTLVVTLDLPGVDPDKVDLSVDGRTLTVTATRESGDVDGDVVLLRGRSYGTVRRQLSLPEGLDLTRVTAGFDAGVLTVEVPLAEQAKPRRITIEQRGRKQIETS